MGAEQIQIGELKIRVAGLSRPAARELGRQVASEIAAGLQPGGHTPDLGAVRIRVAMPEGTAPGQMSSVIARAILGSLR